MKKPIDTIVACATPPGRGGVAIIRISGSLVKDIATHLFGKLPTPRYATYTSFFDLDKGLILYFPAPHSFTGEDILELHGHGGPIIVNQLITKILELGARLAKPGEFSERAFLNEKIDLVQAEAIADLIAANSEKAARAALHSLQGDFSKKIHALVESLIHLRMYVEASIDFVDEEIDFLNNQQVSQQLTSIMQQVIQVEASAIQGSLLQEGITVVIAGKPNVGKSTLLNLLSGKEIAIVTDIPGTTRDILREYLVMDGIPLHVVDTAGLRESEDYVEQIGIRRAREEIARADLVLLVIDASTSENIQIKDFLPEIPLHATIIKIRNKIDLIEEKAEIYNHHNHIEVSISAKNQLGIDLLKREIKNAVGFKDNTEGLFSARRRHLDALSRAKLFLSNAEQQLQQKAGELLAEELRQAQLALSEITGEFTTDDLLGKIFSNFCIGK